MERGSSQFQLDQFLNITKQKYHQLHLVDAIDGTFAIVEGFMVPYTALSLKLILNSLVQYSNFLVQLVLENH